ncbi:hypothetical protein [Konateibacter massiliensis]|uniref:hypothetical protein n=1 Tax=Konateibacter massiliensis TaxID=2002841 RepID=UPI000C146BB8|nr:hypothetical protein [Konateibacter massiliensis]
MKLNFSLKNKEASLEADVEGVIEKGFEHRAKNPNRKTRHQIKQEEKRLNEELKQKKLIQGMLLMMGLIVFALIICAIGSALNW